MTDRDNTELTDQPAIEPESVEDLDVLVEDEDVHGAGYGYSCNKYNC